MCYRNDDDDDDGNDDGDRRERERERALIIFPAQNRHSIRYARNCPLSPWSIYR